MRHRTRPHATVLLALLAALVPIGCGSQRDAASSGPPAARSNPPRIALIMKSLANEFFVTMAEGAKAHQAANPQSYTLIVNGIRNESDLSQQVALVEQMMAEGVDAIVIAPADSRALVPVLAKALRQHVVVVNIDNKLDSSTLQQVGVEIPFVGPDNRAGARMVGTTLADASSSGRQGRDPRGHSDGVQRAAAPAWLRRRDARGRRRRRDGAECTLGAGRGEHGHRGDTARASGSQSHPRQQRQHGPRRGGRSPAGRRNRQGARRRFRQHCGGPPAHPGWPRGRDGRSTCRSTRRLRYRIRAEDPSRRRRSQQTCRRQST